MSKKLQQIDEGVIEDKNERCVQYLFLKQNCMSRTSDERVLISYEERYKNVVISHQTVAKLNLFKFLRIWLDPIIDRIQALKLSAIHQRATSLSA